MFDPPAEMFVPTIDLSFLIKTRPIHPEKSKLSLWNPDSSGVDLSFLTKKY